MMDTNFPRVFTHSFFAFRLYYYCSCHFIYLMDPFMLIGKGKIRNTDSNLISFWVYFIKRDFKVIFGVYLFVIKMMLEAFAKGAR